MKKIIVKGIILFLVGIVLLSVRPVEARRVRNIESIYSSLRTTLVGIGYENDAEEISALITEVFPNLGELRGLSDKEKISALSQLIKEEITYLTSTIDGNLVNDNVFDLLNILRSKKVNCLGYAQLFYVLGKALGLDVEVISAYSDNQDHTANLIKSYRWYVILDLSLENGYYKSEFFNWDDNYEKKEAVWCLKEKSRIPDIYRFVQRLDERGIIAARYNSYGVAKAELGLYEEAMRDYDEAAGLNPDEYIIYNNRGNAKANLGLYEDSIRDFDKAIELHPYFDTAYCNRGSSKYDLGLYEEAMRDYDEAIRLNPNLAEAYNNRGVLKSSLGQEQDAIRDFNKAIELNSRYAWAYCNRGETKYRLGQYEAAIEDFDRAIALNPNAADFFHNRGLARNELGRTQGAIEDFRKAISLNPDLYNDLPNWAKEILPKP